MWWLSNFAELIDGSALDRDVHAGGRCTDAKRRLGRGRKVKLERCEISWCRSWSPSQAGEVHWTGVKVHGWLREQLELGGLQHHGRYLHDLGYNLRVPRPWPERQMRRAKRFLRACASGRPIPPSSYGLPTVR